MADFSELPSLNLVTLQHEATSGHRRSWRLLLSSFNAMLVAFFLWFAFEGEYQTRGRCGNVINPVNVANSVCPVCIAINLCIWASARSKTEQELRRLKLLALLTIIFWCSVIGGIHVGRMLPIDGESQSSVPAPQNNRL